METGPKPTSTLAAFVKGPQAFSYHSFFFFSLLWSLCLFTLSALTLQGKVLLPFFSSLFSTLSSLLFPWSLVEGTLGVLEFRLLLIFGRVTQVKLPPASPEDVDTYFWGLWEG